MRTLFITLLFVCSLLGTSALRAQSCCEANAACTDKTREGLVAKSTDGFKNMAAFTNDPAFVASHRDDAPYVLVDAKGKSVSYPIAGGGTSTGYFVAAKGKSDKALIIVHDWRGLTDEAKQQADTYAEKLDYKVHVLAIDLYDGKVGTSPQENGALMKALSENRAHGVAIVEGARDYINKAVGSKARIGTLGWCMGGSWSFTTSVALGDQAAACVIYYGQPDTDPAVLAAFKAPVLMHVPENDKWITPTMGAEFKAAMTAAGKSAEVINYPNADHAFANPTGGRFVSEAAVKADAASVEFLKKNLVGR
jgi:carboxymethylenebutenolidase